MKAPFSQFLASQAEGLKALIALLGEKYDYVSVLSTDSKGFAARISQKSKSVVNDTMTTERGHVVRVHRDGLYSEAAFNEFDPAHPERTAEAIGRVLDAQLAVLRAAGVQPYETAIPNPQSP